MKSKRKSQASSMPGPPGYRQDIQTADEVIAQTGAEIRPDNWQQNDATLAPRIFFNRGIVRFALQGDRQAALADVSEALRRKPDYAQAKEVLRTLQGKSRWLPW